MTIKIQISTPVLPNTKMVAKLTKAIKSAVDNNDVEVSFYESGFDSFGQNKFDILAIDSARHELTEVRNTVMVELFNVLFQNSK